MHDADAASTATDRALQDFIDALQQFVLLASALDHSLETEDRMPLDTDVAARRAVNAGSHLRNQLLELQKRSGLRRI